jgi:WD40 repeat protein
LPPNNSPISALAFSTDAKRLLGWAIEPPNSVIQVYDVATGTAVKRLNLGSGYICLAFSADRSLVAVGGQGKVTVWNVDKGEQLGGELPTLQKNVSDLILTPDNKYLIMGDAIGEIKIWDLAKRVTPVRSFAGHTKSINAFAISPDGTRFATAGTDNVVKLWETATGRELRQWATGCQVRNLAYTPDGKHVATANSNTTLYLLQAP